jgi:hypothetical protein
MATVTMEGLAVEDRVGLPRLLVAGTPIGMVSTILLIAGISESSLGSRLQHEGAQGHRRRVP